MSEESTPTSPQSLINLLDQLILPPDPAPISMVPQTFGWLVLAILLISATLFAVVKLRSNRAANAYRHAALAILPQVADDPEKLAELVRKTALTAYPRQEVASLYGEDWLEFLDASYKGSQFREGPGRFLASAPYQNAGKVPAGAADIVRDWITHHQPHGVG